MAGRMPIRDATERSPSCQSNEIVQQIFDRWRLCGDGLGPSEICGPRADGNWPKPVGMEADCGNPGHRTDNPQPQQPALKVHRGWVLVTTLSTLCDPQALQTRRLCQSGMVVSGPYRAACWAGSGSI